MQQRKLADNMREKIDAAETATKDRKTVHLAVSRQDYNDLVEAYRFLRQTSPWLKSVGQRLEKLALDVREALDNSDSVSMQCQVVSNTKKHNGHNGHH